MQKHRTNSCKKLFVTDFDGTLIRSDGRISDNDIQALESLRRQGIKTAIATGRSLYSFDQSPGANLPVDYIIFSSGAGVVDQANRELLYHKNLSTKMVRHAVDFMHQAGFDFMLHKPVPDNHQYSFCRLNGCNVDFETRVKNWGDFGEPWDLSPPAEFGEAAQLLAVIPPDRAVQALKTARAGLPGLSVIRATSPLDHRSTWIEVFHPQVSKSQTSNWLAARLGVSPCDSMAIGNDYNDLDLLNWAGNSFVVENAPADLKQGFNLVASNNDDGVAEAIARWFEIRPGNKKDR